MAAACEAAAAFQANMTYPYALYSAAAASCERAHERHSVPSCCAAQAISPACACTCTSPLACASIDGDDLVEPLCNEVHGLITIHIQD